ncbi:MAG: EamA family transporter [Eubacteriales bacterium]|nr:EamA family transporter [Eubacteriales bacterium]
MKIDVHYLFLVVSVVVASVSQVLLKKGAMRRYDSWLREYLNPWVISGYLLMFCSVFLTVTGLRGVDFFNAPVVESLGYVLVPVLGAVFFRESLTRRKLVGIGCIILGMVVFYL